MNMLSIKKMIKKPLLIIAIILFSAIFLITCIEEYTPDIDETGQYLAVTGSIIKGDTVQEVNISWTKAFNDDTYEEISGCEVWVEDNSGNRFDYTETSTGTYQAKISQDYLVFNAEFRLHIITTDDNEYQSEWEPILESAEVDSLYPQIESYQSSSEYYSSGYQFYIDLKAIEGGTKNYKWTVEETYEYHSSYYLWRIWWPNENPELDSMLNMDYLSIDTFYICYETDNVDGIYTATTQNLTVNEKKNIPLSYVAATDYKLKYNYSILVKQYALSDDAYEYWNTNMVSLSESGGLYETQPSQTTSNIYNVNDDEELVVGFFWASSYTEYRLVEVDPISGNYDDPYTCSVDTIEEFDVSQYPLEYYYLTIISTEGTDTLWGTSSNSCFDCTMRGGTLEKPDFW